MIYHAHAVQGMGRATTMHARRGPHLSAHLGVDLFPGTLNVRLGRAFLWQRPDEVDVPDAVDWSDLKGPWMTSTAMLQPCMIGGVRAWAFRLHRSRAPADLVELLSDVRLRGAVPEWPATLVAP